ncbi:hypothetical protein TrCOL_g10816 [Triparma columacea]|uniref:Uncharacterized protein n=1 Tax=Triparma columacea TaxID=722753 RepID=A0A9W7GQH9_9STRA|nr:hypothetical protein TrCOL_g10816 [Triparma columacea]
MSSAPTSRRASRVVSYGSINPNPGPRRASSLSSPLSRRTHSLHSQPKDEAEDFAKKAAWNAAELAGNIVSAVSKDSSPPSPTSIEPPPTFADAISCLREDYDASYFLSGKLINDNLYAPDCTFADPFASFDGRDRFISNLSNLALFVKDYKTKVIDFDIDEDTKTVFVNVLVKLVLNLPWRPRLSWVWGVEHKFTPSPPFQVTTHTESWSVSALDGVKQIFRPGRPTKNESR